MPKRKTNTAATAAAARKNGLKAGRANTLRAAERFGNLTPKQQQQALSDAERFAKARADGEEQRTIKQRLANEARSRQLIPALEVHEWRHRLVSGIRRELDALKVVLLDVVPDPLLVDSLTKAASIVNSRIRARLQAMPELKDT